MTMSIEHHDSLFPSAQILGLILVLAITIYTINRKRYRFPPGPKGLPLLGNILDVPNTFQWFTYEKFCQKYNSPIIHLNMLGTHVMVVNEYEVAQNLLEKRGLRYGDRRHSKIVREIAGHDWNFGFAPLNAYWKACRKAFDNEFKPAAVKKLRPRMTRFLRTLLLRRLVENPTHFAEHCHFVAVALSLDVSYGLDIKEDDDPFVKIVHECIHAVNETSNYQYVDIFSWVKYLPAWFPGMDWKRKAPYWRDWNIQMRDIPFDSVIKAINEQTARPSVASSLLEAEEPPAERVIRDTTAVIIALAFQFIKAEFPSGSVDTMVAMLQCFFLVLSIFPEAQKAAQDEIDRVIGSGRLPEFDDEPNLPYVKAFYRELLRWACVGPLALPHMAMEDDIWMDEGKSYFIPKGSTIFGNVWAMCRDERMYPNSHKFQPSRHLDENGRLNPEIREPDMLFGFRPRHCPGRWYAEDLLFIVISTVLSVFRVVTEDGKPPKTTEWSKLMKPGLIVYPLPFRVKIIPRSEKAAELVYQAEIHASG